MRKKLLDTLQFGHAEATKMLGEAKIFWWPNKSKEVEDKTKFCVACMASVMNLNYQIPKKTTKTKTITEPPGQKLQIGFSGNMNHKN